MRRFASSVLVVLATALLGIACQRAEVRAEEERAAIEETLRAYLTKLARAYEKLDAGVLRPQAANREVVAVQTRIEDLANQGRQVRPRLQSMTVEELEMLRGLNAHVRTHEVWDLRVFALGTDSRLSATQDQIYRVRYQLSKNDGRWQVLFREVQSPSP